MRLLILIFSIGAVFFSCSLSSDADEESFNISIAISSPNNQAIISDSVFIDLEIDYASMISKVELWINNDSTGIQDPTPLFPLSGIQRNIKTVAMIFLSGPMICKAKSLIVGLLQSQLAISWSSLKHLAPMKKVN